jgi:hypothetical protein
MSRGNTVSEHTVWSCSIDGPSACLLHFRSGRCLLQYFVFELGVLSKDAPLEGEASPDMGL